MQTISPWEMVLLCAGVGYLSLSGNITKTTEVGGVQNLAEGAHEPLINSHDEITVLILEVPLQNLVIDLIFKAVMLTSSVDETLCQVFWPPRLLLLLASTLGDCFSPPPSPWRPR